MLPCLCTQASSTRYIINPTFTTTNSVSYRSQKRFSILLIKHLKMQALMHQKIPSRTLFEKQSKKSPICELYFMSKIVDSYAITCALCFSFSARLYINCKNELACNFVQSLFLSDFQTKFLSMYFKQEKNTVSQDTCALLLDKHFFCA